MPLWPSSTRSTAPAAAAKQYTHLVDVEDESCAHEDPQPRPHPPQVHPCERSWECTTSRKACGIGAGGRVNGYLRR